MPTDSQYLSQIEKFLIDIRYRASGGLTVAELAQSTADGMRLAMSLLDTVVSMTGEEKKAEVLKLVAYLFDQFSDACVPMLAKPAWWIVKPAVRALILSVASGLVEALLPTVRVAT